MTASATTSTTDLSELISNRSRVAKLSFPDVKRITDVRKFMADAKNDSIEKLMEFIAGQEKQCQEVLKTLREQVQQKMQSLHQLKADMLELQRQLNLPNAEKCCKIMQVQITDGDETHKCDVAEALVRYSLNMSSLYFDILGLDSDVDYANYLANMASVNKEFIQHWYKCEKINKSKIATIRI